MQDPQDFDHPDYETEDEEDNELDHSSQEENSQQGHNEVDPNEVYEDVHNDPIQLDPGTAPVQAEEEAEDEEQQEQKPTLHRSTRAAREPSWLQPTFGGKSYAQVQDPEPAMECTAEEAKVLAMIMCQINERMVKSPKTVHSTQCVITYSLKKGIQKFGEKGRQAAL